MDPERSHGSSMSDLFICFTSVPSSVNRKLMMRNNSSLKTGGGGGGAGGQASSIFFNGRKKGSTSGLENPEPSSPKVTCIGQVRIKSKKKQSKKMRACRSIGGGRDEVTSSTSSSSSGSKKWVHFPLTVCEALRSFGAEYFKCFLPCTRSSSMAATNLREKDEKTEVRSGGEDDDDDDDDEMIKEETLTQVSSENGPQKEAIGMETITQERSQLECPEVMGPDPEDESKEGGSQQNVLPECLLLMMCEPKLSMEVSKETWVCKRDFMIREEKERQTLVKQMDGGDEPLVKQMDCDPAPVSLQLPPSSSSCPLPASPPPVTVANEGDATGSGGPTTPIMVDQKPLVLKRCMSEPMRSSAKLFPSLVKI